MDIRNFHRIKTSLSTSGQPTVSQLAEMAAEGYQAIVNLGLTGQAYSLPDEQGTVLELNMEYHHIPVLFDKPQLADLETFFRVMDQLNGQKVHVHCAANYRAMVFTGLYLVTEKELTKAALTDFIGHIWQPDAVWQVFIEDALQMLASRKG